MLIDAAGMEDGELVEAGICVVGAGVAGLTVARELARAGADVCLLESGGVTPSEETRDLDRGESVGHPYYRLHEARSRAFGGTSHRWLLDLGDGRRGARLRPLDPIDFERRDWVPHSGWPFGLDTLEPFYRRANELTEAGPYAYEWDEIEPAGRRALHENTDSLRSAIYRFVAKDVFTRALREEMREARSVRVLLRATVLEIETNPEGTRVTALRTAVPAGEIRVRAPVVVLAMGGIEIPRTLLLSRGDRSVGLGNGHDLVGRFFMEHPHTWAGFFAPTWTQEELADYHTVAARSGPRVAQVGLREEVLRREGLLNFSVHLVPGPRPAPIRPALRRSALALARAARSLGGLDLPGAIRAAAPLPRLAAGLAVAGVRKPPLVARYLRGKELPVHGFRMNTMAEQAPNPDSRVTLGEETDRFGRRRARLDWRLSDLDLDSLRRCRDILDSELRRAGHGRLERLVPPDVLPVEIHGGWHHMGTTRMHDDPRHGVVDADCRVHGVGNLYVAGPSVFPTGGCANPILTVVALALRLADHIRGA